MDPVLQAPGWYQQPHVHAAATAAAAAVSHVQLPGQTEQLQYQQHLHTQVQGISDMSASDSSDSDADPVRVPLKLVVQDAVKRWFAETLSEARKGDVKQQALLAQMYAEGYGCKQDLEQSKMWAERAKQRGYQMMGVYCSAP
eukprot:gene9130-9298_t